MSYRKRSFVAGRWSFAPFTKNERFDELKRGTILRRDELRATNDERPTTNDSLPMSTFLQLVKERVIVYDGAMGTNIQTRNPTLDDYWGKENCSEVLVLSRPDIIREIHADFFQVGCDIVETNTFGGSRIVLSEFELPDRVFEINVKAAQLAREVAQQFSTKERP